MSSKHEPPDRGDQGRAAGGRARAKSLSASRRSEIARKAADSRWAEVKDAVCGSPDKPLVIGGVEIECYVLEDGTRVLTQAAFLQALGRSPRAKGISEEMRNDDLPPILQGKNIQPYLPADI